MKATKLPSGNWRVQAFIGKDENGKNIMKSFTHHDKRVAMMKAAEYVDQHRDTSVRSSFGAAAEAYLRYCETACSPSTTAGYVSIYKNLKKEFTHFFTVPCSMIAEEDIADIIEALEADGLSAKTIQNRYFFISAVCKYKKIRINCSYLLPARKRARLTIPTTAQVQAILGAAKQKDIELWICLALAALGPLRASEIAALRYRWEDCDFKHNTIHVTHALVKDRRGNYVLKEPKSDMSNRIITIPQEVMDAIQAQGYVTNYHSAYIYRHFKYICRDLCIEGVRLHDLRHYCASMLHAKGYPDAYIQARTGHSTIAVLRDVYTHALGDEKIEMEKRMMNDFNALLSV